GIRDFHVTGVQTCALPILPCDVWQAIDAGVRIGWGRGVWAVYGFKPDLTWVGHVLAVDEQMRAQTSARLTACGLANDGPAVPPRSEEHRGGKDREPARRPA